MGHSLMIVGCLMGMDVRICGPKQLWPADEFIAIARGLQAEVRCEADHHRRSHGSGQGRRLHPHRRLGVDGRAQGSLEGAHRPADAFQVNAELMKASGNPQVKFMHCLPAFHDTETTLGKQIAEDLRHRRTASKSPTTCSSPNEHRLRAGREPHAHDQGDSRRHAGRLSHAGRHRPGRQRPPRAASR